jgi:hypothetical protein
VAKYNTTLPNRTRLGVISSHTGMARVPKLSESISAKPARIGSSTGNDVTMSRFMFLNYG